MRGKGIIVVVCNLGAPKKKEKEKKAYAKIQIKLYYDIILYSLRKYDILIDFVCF